MIDTSIYDMIRSEDEVDSISTLASLSHDPSMDWSTILYWAAAYQKPEIIRWIIKQGVSVNSSTQRGHTALNAATEADHGSIVEFLLSVGAEVTDLDMLQAARSSPECLRMILAHSSLINVQGHAHRTPLMEAVIAGKVANVHLLLAHGADPAMQTTYGYTAADFAQARHYDEILTILTNQHGG